VLPAGLSQAEPAKKPKPSLKPALSWTRPHPADVGFPIVQHYTLVLNTKGKWVGPVTVVAQMPGLPDQVFADVRDGQVLAIHMGPAGLSTMCAELGALIAKDRAGNRSFRYTDVRYWSA
jgi:hypothetical protein